MSLPDPSGFAARRNGSCSPNEVDCGRTVDPFHACCPALAFCPRQRNINCCPSPANCTATLLQNPTCANSTWSLYDNHGYFCCPPGTIGYNASRTFSDGCADPGPLPSGARALAVVSAGQTTTSSTAASTATPSADTPPADTPPAHTSPGSSVPSSPSHSNTGAIVGGVVGGVAAVVIATIIAYWFFRKRKSKTRSTEDQSGPRTRSFHEMDTTTQKPNEADGMPLSELSATTKPTPIGELP
ncbi:MAG: hypothetical protein LQ349_006731 [Xanthoria aureola]|nr:MAG: hypothetical protein LQ349_006731 [Xanthoria aureola]